MLKRNIFITVAFGALLLPGIIQTTNITDEEAFNQKVQEKAQQELKKLKLFYDELIKGYDKEIINLHEANIKKEQENFITINLESPTHLKNTANLERVTDNLLKHLHNVSHLNDAYATTSMIFMINWSELISKALIDAKTVKDKMILKDVNDTMKHLIEKIFLEPMTRCVEETQKKIMAKQKQKEIELELERM